MSLYEWQATALQYDGRTDPGLIRIKGLVEFNGSVRLEYGKLEKMAQAHAEEAAQRYEFDPRTVQVIVISLLHQNDESRMLALLPWWRQPGGERG